jgi:hypothetical protein
MGYIVLVAVVGVLLISILVWQKQKRHQSFEGEIKERVAKLQHMADTRKFHSPDDTDLDPTIEYLNASKPMDSNRYDVVVFAAGGIVEKQLDLSEDDVQQLAKTGNWTRTADQYHTGDGGIHYTMQFERRRQ